MFLRWSSIKIVQSIWFRQKTWPPGGGAYFPYMSIKKALKIFLSETIVLISVFFADMFLWWSSAKIVPAIWIRQKYGHQGAGLFSPIYLYRKLEKSFVRNHWTDFNITWQKCFLGDHHISVHAVMICHKTWSLGGGLIFPIYLYRNLKKIFLSETSGPIAT